MVVYAPRLRNQWQETGSHFSMATGRRWPAPASWFHLLSCPLNHFPNHRQRECLPLRPLTQSRTRRIQHLNLVLDNKPRNRRRRSILRLAGPFVLLHSPGDGESEARLRLASRTSSVATHMATCQNWRRIQHDVRLVFPPTHVMRVESPTRKRFIKQNRRIFSASPGCSCIVHSRDSRLRPRDRRALQGPISVSW
jgi:hypothetical protein